MLNELSSDFVNQFSLEAILLYLFNTEILQWRISRFLLFTDYLTLNKQSYHCQCKSSQTIIYIRVTIAITTIPHSI